MATKTMTLGEAVRIGRCSRCNKRIHKDPGSNMTVRKGILVGFICSRCQTPDETAEAVINESTLDYSPGTDAFGRMVARIKGA